MDEMEYDDGLAVFIVLAICWAISFEFAVIVGLSWAISGVSRSNAIKVSEQQGG